MISILLIIEASRFHFHILFCVVNMCYLSTLLPIFIHGHAWRAQAPYNLWARTKLPHVNTARSRAIQMTSLHFIVELTTCGATPPNKDQNQCYPYYFHRKIFFVSIIFVFPKDKRFLIKFSWSIVLILQYPQLPTHNKHLQRYD